MTLSRVAARIALFAAASLLIWPAQTSAQAPAPAPTQKPSSAKSRPLLPWEVAAGSRQEFDVISIRENKSGVPWSGGDPQTANIPYGPDDNYRNSGGVFSATNYPLLNLIVFAYKVWTPQGAALAASLPVWTNTAGFNIEARTDNHNVTKDQMRLMMQALLADRFHLVLHTETRQVPLYAAVLAKPGKLGPACVRIPPTIPAPASLSRAIRTPPAHPRLTPSTEAFPSAAAPSLASRRPSPGSREKARAISPWRWSSPPSPVSATSAARCSTRPG
jgi:hypothetical protein